ncbi:ferritin-like domain-containing protein [Hymenobacter sp. BT683]|uniref:Ferritin-like domain-containing protein n=1 Tax=Hymenobacter jeongseonensis TaxID=2791027 RepID=A0ABS0IL84_9BACT|nr:ferritin-like domain-containing protein [Hymenobacter jeongseonensis]MBF9239132.1 ferritin-like domain-containing protein [Hymenobacter jeongseonensis]
MNFFNIINQLSEVDPDVMGRLDTRRSVFNSLTTVSKRAALASAPAFLAAFFSKAYAGTTAGDPKEVFNYALTLEYLEEDFYKKVVASPIFATVSADDQAAIRQILKHETAHVNLLKTVITTIGGTPTAPVTFKATTFATLTSFQAQLQVAQLLEDTGVRAYKGRAGDLLGIPDVNITGVGMVNPLQAALQIHSVEARHAAHIRYMRGQTPWISGDGDLDGQEHYKGAIPESNTTQSGVDITKLGGGYTAKDAQASFDEILTKAEVLAPSRAGGLVG